MLRSIVLIMLLVALQGIGTQEMSAQSYPYDGGQYYNADNKEAVDMFYEPLSSYGSWIAHEEYGLVWRPNGFYHTDWRPYTAGYWAYTDYGWTWVSDEPWSWACYHYGRWFYDNRFGWLWYPDTVWGPAWVVWRYGGGRIGWAPMPPKIIWNAQERLGFTYADIDELVPYEHFCFVEVVDFVRVDIVKFIVFPKDRHDFIVRDTKVVLGYRRKGDRIVNNLPIQERVEQAAQEPIKELRVVETGSLDNQGMGGGEIRVFRPRGHREEVLVPQARAPVEVERRGANSIQQRQAPVVGIEHRGPGSMPQPQAQFNIERRGPGRARSGDTGRRISGPSASAPLIIERIERRGTEIREEARSQRIDIIERRDIEGRQVPRQERVRGPGSQDIIRPEITQESQAGVILRGSNGKGEGRSGEAEPDRRRRRGGSARDEDEMEGRRGRGPADLDFRNQGAPPPRLR